MKRIEDGSYGFCEETGEEIGLGRLEARPIATLTVDAQERREMLMAALDTLPPGQRDVIELHWFQERPYREIAEIVGSSEGAVRVRAHRAYAKLKEILGGKLAEG